QKSRKLNQPWWVADSETGCPGPSILRTWQRELVQADIALRVVCRRLAKLEDDKGTLTPEDYFKQRGKLQAEVEELQGEEISMPRPQSPAPSLPTDDPA